MFFEVLCRKTKHTSYRHCLAQMYQLVQVDRWFITVDAYRKKNIRRVKIMEQVGYKPNLIARSLAVKSRYHLVALIPDFRPGVTGCDGIWHSSGRRGGKSYGWRFLCWLLTSTVKPVLTRLFPVWEMPETVDGVIVGTFQGGCHPAFRTSGCVRFLMCMSTRI